MIATVDSLPLHLFPRPYHDVMARSMIEKPRADTVFYLDEQSQIPAVYHPDLGFSYHNPEQKDMEHWARWIFKKRIPLIAGELHSHYNLLAAMANILPEDCETQVLCRYEFQDFCIMTGAVESPPDNMRLQKATSAETDKLFTFYERSETMKAKSRESLRFTIENNQMFYLKKTGKPVSAALTHCENTLAGLIGGVYTPKKMRGKGYAKYCMQALMQSLRQEQKTPCLFYEKNNMAAKKLYQNLGFQPHGEWVVIEMTYEEPAAG